MKQISAFRRASRYFLRIYFSYAIKFITLTISWLYKKRDAHFSAIKDSILLQPAVVLSEQIKQGDLSAEQVVQSFINQIKRVNSIVNALVDKRFRDALNQAREIDKKLAEARNSENGDKSLLKLPLIGIPFTVKETIALEGAPFTAGLLSKKCRRATRSNEAVDKLIKSGMIPIGSTNTPCMNMSWMTCNNLYGRTENPYDLSRIVGGSSGGEAALMATAATVVGVGSDIGGSIRIPANFCGIFGHKPSPYTVSTDGIIPCIRKEQEPLCSVGPITRYSSDLIPMFKIMVKNEMELKKLNLDEPVDLSELKIYYCDFIGDPMAARCSRDILAGLNSVLEHFRSRHKVNNIRRVNFEEFKYGLMLWGNELKCERGHILESEHENGLVEVDHWHEFGKWLFGASEYPLHVIFATFLDTVTAPYGSKKYLFLKRKAIELRQKFNEILGDDGVLLLPTHPEGAPHHQTAILKTSNVSYTALGNVLHAPITQCPLGMTRDGLPFGVQIISKPYNDRLTLAVACELEKVFGGWFPPSKIAL